ncbi:hypothetical protein BDL97_01G085700 [Sphagnum fallax]|nr:hypothetical protein BDL97_01G085700 [Sphagnum fallax]
MESVSELLTEQEAAIYDRQIRIWGADAQRKLSKARILVVGITGVVAETCKNIVLAGIGSLVLMDDSPMTFEASAANFLVPFDELEGQGNSIATVCASSLRDFNPMVQVSVEEGGISSKPDEFYDRFDAVIMGRSSITLRTQVNEACRKRPHRVAFYSVDCRGTCGSLFVDLQRHSFTSKKAGDDKAAQQDISFPSLQEALNVPWSSFNKRTSKLLFVLRIIDQFEVGVGRRPGQLSSQDLPDLISYRGKMCAIQKVPESFVPDNLLQKLASVGGTELPPVCAIIGGILGQELIKAMSCKGEPLKNFFFFDASDGKGIIECVVPSQMNDH